jgi:hypothetical protein
MSETAADPNAVAGASREEMLAALFADLVGRQTNMALMFLGQAPLPHTSERTVDLDAAQMFIDQLEMIEVKTRGNLTKLEEQLLRQSLTQLRMIFVQVSEHPPAPAAQAKAPTPPPAPPPADAPGTSQPASSQATAPSAGETKVIFSKKY